ncbi:hypothetical protein BDV09DRAFT_166036 [Aspergillus tetrazonus]
MSTLAHPVPCIQLSSFWEASGTFLAPCQRAATMQIPASLLKRWSSPWFSGFQITTAALFEGLLRGSMAGCLAAQLCLFSLLAVP